MRVSLAARWREMGREVGERYAANRDAYEAAGLGDPSAYRRQLVAQSWPAVSPLVRRYIREGFDAALGAPRR